MILLGMFLVGLLMGAPAFGGGDRGGVDSVNAAKQNAAKEMGLKKEILSPGPGWERISPTPFPAVWMPLQPWWRSKEKVQRKLSEENAVVVSVVSDQSKIRQLKMTGAGWVKAPVDFTFNQIKDFNQFKGLSGYIKDIHFEPTSKILYLQLSALSISFQFWFQLLFVEENHERDKSGSIPVAQRRLFFQVIKGSLSGMTGVVEVSALKNVHFYGSRLQSQPAEVKDSSEIALSCIYQTDDWPFPPLITSWGLEVILKQLAEKLREIVEVNFRIKEKHG